MELRYVNRLVEKDTSKEKAKSAFSYEEIACNNIDIKKLRDFLNNLNLGDDE